MTIAFTICSINYLAQARTLGTSLKKTNPDVRYFVGLVDRLDDVQFEPGFLPDFSLIEVHTIGIGRFEEMCDRYNITELNTAVKPFYFTYFFSQFPEAQQVIYFDPDIIVYQPLTELINQLKKHEAVVTPHICTPIEDTKTPNELHHLNTGVYNLGFCAFRRSIESLNFIRWWEEKLRYECLISLCDGLFVDQNWMNFLPLFIENTCIEKNPGYNMAYWNLHERQASQIENEWIINDLYPLLFFHYSGYDPKNPDDISKYQDRFTFQMRPDLKPLFEIYHNQLLENGNSYYRTFPCRYIKPNKIYKYARVRKALTDPLKKLVKALESYT
ncbi:glycosyltransferase family protein [Arundinibacter roseus]|uniref:Glycosyl transferase n=1 Tax=Arundinibacter roseus TaxID=2070510 RepID=A0A4R4K9R0_9BACT|nr:glycosyl transferase [Arundinibacter roseus]TDB64488.1 glycosyl transferase [Arundinibacter roseus]